MNESFLIGVNVLCWISIGLIVVASVYIFFKLLYNTISNYNRIKKESKYLLDIEFEGGKLDKKIYDNALTLVSALCQRNIFDVSLEPCGENEIAINIKSYLVYLSLTNDSIAGFIEISKDPKRHIKFIFDIDKPTWQYDTCKMITRAIEIKERK